MLSHHALEELKTIYEEEYGETLTDQEALEIGHRLLTLFQVIGRPLPCDPDHSSGNSSPG